MAKQENILDAAERLFYRGGFHATGIDRIVAEANVTPRTLYRHFRSKDALVQAVLERREARFLATLDALLNPDTSDESERWRRLLTGMEAWFTDEGDRGCMFFRALGEYTERNDTIANLVLAHKRRVLDEFRRRVAASPTTSREGLAEGLMLLMEGAVALAPVLGGRQVSAHAAAAAARLFADAEDTKSSH